MFPLNYLPTNRPGLLKTTYQNHHPIAWTPTFKILASRTKGGGLGKIRDSGGTFAYQVNNFMMSKYLDNFHNFIIFIVLVDLHWYVYYVNVSVSVRRSANVFLLQKCMQTNNMTL